MDERPERLPATPRDDRDPAVEQRFYAAMRYLAGAGWMVGAEREALLALRGLLDRKIGDTAEVGGAGSEASGDGPARCLDPPG